MLMTHAQIAKATKDHLEANWERFNVSSGLSEKQVWRIGYIYADVYMDYFGRPTRKQFEDLHFDCLPEAIERFEIEREMWLASRP